MFTAFKVLAVVFTLQAIYSLFTSNMNFGVLFLCAAAVFFWLVVLLRAPLTTFAGTLPGKICCGAFGAGAAVFCALFAFVCVSGFAFQPKNGEKTVVVLGAALHGSRVSRVLQYRLDKAYEYYLQNPVAVFFTTVGQGRQEDLPEGRAMKQYLEDKGIPADQIFAEENSMSTEENFAFSKAILDEEGVDYSGGIVLVTNAFHCYRAVQYAKMAGFTEVAALPAGLSPGAFLNCYCREVFALVYFWLFRTTHDTFITGLVGYLKMVGVRRF